MSTKRILNCTGLIGKAAKGKSPLITVDFIKDWEARYGRIERGDVVVFHTSYCPRYYKPFPAGNRMVYDVVEKGTAVGWPGPAPEPLPGSPTRVSNAWQGTSRAWGRGR